MVMANIVCRIPKNKAAGFVIPFEEPEGPVTKWCHQCRRWKLYSEFNKNKSRGDGVCSECRDCEIINRRQRRAK